MCIGEFLFPQEQVLGALCVSSEIQSLGKPVDRVLGPMYDRESLNVPVSRKTPELASGDFGFYDCLCPHKSGFTCFIS